ncbi:hypothetical protein [Alkalihalobacillus sp. LMS39]|uniref:hypothetical protein n=1 Tax=Alkalihalobacillus sp. LMS39 TaxID=2924032 RepID=UPI001FB3DC4D|nr:hypothetical protein [Alkalihalobacillus sp. LMS39]UOE93068.1 hypothetical protein MM271_17890 [Alkalihalobacillus sp. LMS39]
MFELHFIIKVYNLIKASLFFWLYLCKGFVVYGFIPALCGVVTVIDAIRKDRKENEVSVRELYRESYAQYQHLTLFSFFVSIFLILSYVSLYFVNATETNTSTLLVTIILLYLLAIFIVIVSYSIYFIVFLKKQPKQALIYGFLTSVKNIFVSIILLAILYGLFYIATINLLLFIVSFPTVYGYAIVALLGKVKRVEVK